MSKLKLTAIAVLLTLLAVAAYVYIQRGKELEVVERELIVQEVKSDLNEKQLDKITESTSITEKVIEEAVNETKAVINKKEKITKTLQQQETVIEQKYPSPTNEEELTQRSQALAQARIESLWKSWCETTRQTSHEGCLQVQALRTQLQ